MKSLVLIVFACTATGQAAATESVQAPRNPDVGRSDVADAVRRDSLRLTLRKTGGETVVLDGRRDAPLSARLILRQTEFAQVDAAAVDRFLTEFERNKARPYALSTRPPAPPLVDAVLELENTSRYDVVLRMDSLCSEAGIELQVVGPAVSTHRIGYSLPRSGAIRYLARNANDVSTVDEETVITRGGTHRIPLRHLMGVRQPKASASGSFQPRRVSQLLYWTKPGQYRLRGVFWAQVRFKRRAAPDAGEPDSGYRGMIAVPFGPADIRVKTPN